MQNLKAQKAIWRLRQGSDRRFRLGHPWVYSNEIQGSPKGILPGSLVELQDASGRFLARGYGNPHSLISFRAISRDPEILDPTSSEYVRKSLLKSQSLRIDLGFSEVSHRVCFGEGDFLPGLVVDRFVVNQKATLYQIFVVQAHTAGANSWMSQMSEILQDLAKKTKIPWEATGIVFRNDLNVRKLEGLEPEAPLVVKNIEGLEWNDISIKVPSAFTGKPLSLKVDLLGGQKTGFFLDQFTNIQLAASRLGALFKNKSKVEILDLCSYVGQWGAQFASGLTESGVKVEVTSVDASAQALKYAQENSKSFSAVSHQFKGDVLKDLVGLENKSYDLVIADPPAFIKSKKDIPQGSRAYLQLFTQAISFTKPGGAIVCCSCSSLFDEEIFQQTLGKAVARNQAEVQWIGKGGPSLDHPVLAEFPEGKYLKAWIGIRRS